MDKPVEVVLRGNGKVPGIKTVFLNPGEEQTLPFTWDAPTASNQDLIFDLEAEINPAPRKIEEITYADDIPRTTVKLLPELQKSACDPSFDNVAEVSGQYEYCVWKVRSDGSLYCEIHVADYYESISISIEQTPTPNPVKAGMGFGCYLRLKLIGGRVT